MKQSLIIATLAVISLSACAQPFPSDAAVCASLDAPVDALITGLLDNPNTSPAVGDPATDIVVIHKAGC